MSGTSSSLASLTPPPVEELKEAVIRAASKAGITVERKDILLEIPANPEHGDYACNLAMVLARPLKKNPMEIANSITAEWDSPQIAEVSVARPGFINFRLAMERLRRVLVEMEQAGEYYGVSREHRGERVLLEFVSANPTGPLHVGHGRGAAVGDVIARLMRRVGFDVTAEYYVNDVGNQMRTLGRSLAIRYRQVLGEEIPFPDDHYQGEYLVDLAREAAAEIGGKYKTESEEAEAFFERRAHDSILEGIKKDLADFGVGFDSYFSERQLHGEKTAKALELLREADLLEEREGALWVRTSSFGDDKDRVVVRDDGRPTYFLADIAYHLDKFDRGFDRLYDLWGQDHHGYIPRVRGTLEALGQDVSRFAVLLIQFVTLTRNGEPVQMSTRSGSFETLSDVVKEVGRDAARYFFLMRSTDSHLDFDLELAKKHSSENPVFYVQYAHTRIQSILREAEGRGLLPPAAAEAPLDQISEPEERVLLLHLARLPELFAMAAERLEPHRLAVAAQNIAGEFHRFYTKHRVMGEDTQLTLARLVLVRNVAHGLKLLLNTLGVDAPERM